MRILVTDLDGTLLDGDAEDRLRLKAALARHPEFTVVFATGRGLSSVRGLLRDPLLPPPRWIIADVGASVIDGTDFSPVERLRVRLRAGWPGRDRVRAALRRFPALVYQHDVVQDGRCSYHLAPDDLTGEITETVRALGCTWIHSAGRYFDVLPPGASKGSALKALAEMSDWAADSILVAGDSLNDLSLFRLGTHSVLVANAEPALRAAVSDEPLVHRPDRPGAAGILAALEALGWVSPGPGRSGRRHRLVVGYHRPPACRIDGGRQRSTSPNGILPTLNSAFADGLPGVWVAADVSRDGCRPDGGTRRPGPPLSLVPLGLSAWNGYFHHACKETLWPVLMSEPHLMVDDRDSWAHYRAVNTLFAEHISAQAAPGGTVWLHDYNLWLVPGLLRAARPDLRIGLFHHTPFPPAKIFAALPAASELRASLACLDWAGFHTDTFAEHFRQTLTGPTGPTGPARLPRVGVHPLGIDRLAIEALACGRIPFRRPTLRHLVLSVERLDYAKAPVHKVDAIARLLRQRPDLRERVTFRLVCPPPEPGITAYDSTRRLLERRIADVNGAWQKSGWQPVEYVPCTLSPTEVVDEYLSADVFWVTSLQDGMNLTAKEFVAAQAAVGTRESDRPGILVLSRHAGAAAEFGDAALLTDPRSPENLGTVLARALALAPSERRVRLDLLSRRLGHEQPVDWAQRIIHAIQE
ncbi:HAD-IIB family hydrolase [Embleya hyalina]|uniref:Trehalose-6-phosphate synthase n=1 Tax=Embleya hyalina TaxID=516124 RepID=A0A401Z5S4_9ACTN|nr:HAD-IIB family hydrolase [Embleya hyalina]GCE02204.1 trehalose-6-phosphate synthase [Embleya hyalina]